MALEMSLVNQSGTVVAWETEQEAELATLELVAENFQLVEVEVGSPVHEQVAEQA